MDGKSKMQAEKVNADGGGHWDLGGEQHPGLVAAACQYCNQQK